MNEQKSPKDVDAINVFIGSKIAQQRIKCNLSQTKLAAALGCSYQLVQKQEAGETRVSAEHLFNIAQVLGVTPNFFFEQYQKGKATKSLPARGDTIKSGIKKKWDILLVEDNPEDEFFFRKSFESIESDCMFSINTCYSGTDALHYLRQKKNTPDLLFVDLNIPKKNGFDVIKDIKNDTNIRHIPIVILSNSVNAEEMLRCYNLNACGYICKSFDLHEFQKKIELTLRYWTEAVVTPRNY